ncbi:hypothetical protein Q7C_1287 [Methylophaga frappieri]|uniref:Metallo-beta-lactamase domain-containing protein n=1 Tax=Methylophaga frappieri (strain ATCC BAA-2434 / DSM 25690 / JAM7) TaxID=754477 RepID=I1YHP4_METFJ|nr:DNA internalization-related competence protein ComEC/Rec2 [Methylophaga frappieri]AFJ02437.1 hypothetical protein Q7C_1287 [Methylophaga frappieri]
MVYSAIAFLLGCIGILQFSSSPGWPVWAVAVVILLSALRYRQYWLVAFIAGCLWAGMQTQSRLADQLSSDQSGKDVTITGYIADIPQVENQRLRFLFEPDPHFNLANKIRLNWYFPPAKKPRTGEYWRLTVRLKSPRGMHNPGGFDYEGWLFQQAIGATGYIREPDTAERLARAPSWHLSAFREGLLQDLQTATSRQHQALIEGLTLGVRDNMTAQQWQTLRHTGTAHLLAISGLHIGLAAMFGFFIGAGLWRIMPTACLRLPARQIGAIFALIFALFYTLLAGMSVPSQRALIMISVAMLAILCRQRFRSSHLLALSLILVLLVDPLAVMGAGFWLSFAAVGIILYVSQYRHPRPRFHWLGIHVWIALGLTPLLLLFFQSSSIISPVANLLAVPLVSLIVVPLLLAASLLRMLSDSLGNYLFELADLALTGLWKWLTWLAELPAAHWQVPVLPEWIIIFTTLAVTLLLAPKGLPHRWLGLLFLLPLSTYSAPRPEPGEFWFALLDVGQGLSAVVITQQHTLVFDTGPAFGDFNTGDAVVKPYLQYLGRNQIDKLIISHGDNDHIGGAQALMTTLSVTDILSSVPEKLTPARSCEAGQSWQWDGVNFDMLYPSKGDDGSSNDRSCVLKVGNANGQLLLTGDIEAISEHRLVKRFGSQLAASVLVVPHHGSRSSSTAAFIDAVSPDIALFANGFANRFGFPAAQVKQRYAKRHILTWQTANSGALLLRFDAQSDRRPVEWRRHQRRLWTATATD